MQDATLQILFLGEHATWAHLSRIISQAPHASLQVRRLDSLTELFQALPLGRSDAVVIDIHAWNFRGLHYVEKVRAQYPSFPIVALYSTAIPGLESKATACGASRTISVEQLSADALQSSLDSILAEPNSKFPLEKTPQLPLPPSDPNSGITVTFSKNQVITHALSNLLCVIAANADLLSDAPQAPNGNRRPLTEIKKAARSAAALMRHLK